MEDQLILLGASVFQLLVYCWCLYLISYYAFGQRFKYTPGQIIGLSIRGIGKAVWWTLAVIFQAVHYALSALLDLDIGSRRTRQQQVNGRRVVAGAHFLKNFGKWKLIRRWNSGLVIDGRRRISREQSYRHLALVAPTGTGKTAGYVIPNLLFLSKKCSAVVTDPSGEIYNKTSGYLLKKGFDIKVLDVSSPGTSLLYNPLERAQTATQLEELCTVILDAAYGSVRGDQQFWHTGGISITSVIIRCLKKQDKRYQNLANVYHLLNQFGTDGKALYPFISEYADEQTYAQFKGFISNSEKVIQGMVATARTALKPFADPKLCELTSAETLDFETIREKPTVLYLIVPEHKMSFYGFLLALFWTQFFSFCMEMPEKGKPYLPIYTFLDEFGNVSRIPGFEQLITTLRKRQVSVSIILQDVQQLTAVYGYANASTILNGGCSSRLYLPGLSHETCRDIEHMLGKQTIYEGKRKETRSLLSADEIRTLDDDQALYVYANRRPVLLRTRPFYKSLRLHARTKHPPAVLSAGEQNVNVAYLTLDATSATSRYKSSEAAEVKAKPKGADQPSSQVNQADVTAKNEDTPTPEIKESEDAEQQETKQDIPSPNIEAHRPPWAKQLLQESLRARQEVEELRDAIDAHDVSRKEAATPPRKTGGTPQPSKNEVVVLTPKEVRSLVKQAAQQGASESLHRVAGDLGQLREILENQRGVLSKAQCMNLMEITSDTTYYQRCRDGLPFYTIGKKRFHFLEEVMDWMRTISSEDDSE